MISEKKKLINRLKRINGHVSGVTKMIEEDKNEADILVQMMAIQAAMKKACGIVVEDKIKQLLSNSIEHSINSQSDECTKCSQFVNLKETLDEMDYDELVDFVLRFTK